MTDKTHCDICEEVIEISYGVPSGTVRKGKGSSRFRLPLRRWLAYKLFGPLFYWSVYKNVSNRAGGRYMQLDLCSDCTRLTMATVQSKVENAD